MQQAKGQYICELREAIICYIIMENLIGKKAPHFVAKAITAEGKLVDQFSLDQYEGKQTVVFFFYPKSFTGVCNSEVLAFQDQLADFEKENIAVVGCCVDSDRTLWAWHQVARENGGIKGVTYPIISDSSKIISNAFGCLAGEYTFDEAGKLVAAGPMISYRGLYVIDKKGYVQHMLINNLPLGRSIEEALRTARAVNHISETGGACNANWRLV
jgi:peroxiredoxin (alkyl hydroperoxide reductase subunit C)